MSKLPVKQLTLMVHSSEYPEVSDSFGYKEVAVTKTREEGELEEYVRNVGFEPRNLSPDHPGYKLWTWKTKRDGSIEDLLGSTK